MSQPTITIERLEERHLTQAHALSNAVKWPHRREDWAFALGLGRGFVAVEGDELLGTIIWWLYGERFTTLGMVIVSPAKQGRGIGRRLMEAAMEEAGPRTVLLNATREGLPLYERFGFRVIGAVRQHQAANALAAPVTVDGGTSLRPMNGTDLATIPALDEKAVGFPRTGMITAIANAGQGLVLERCGAIAAWAFFRRFGRGHVIGPVGAYEDTSAKALILALIARLGSEFLRIDVPVSAGLSAWLAEQGLPQVGEVITMAHGEGPAPGPGASRIFALANQALG